jgi:acetyl esterase/lipase
MRPRTPRSVAPAHSALLAALLCATGVFLCAASTAADLADAPVAAQAIDEDRLPPARIALRGVNVTPDVAYTSIPGFRPLRLDVYVPKAKAGPQPLLVFVHGGGWTVGHKRATAAYADFPGVLASFARRGYVVASVEYRLSGEAPFPAAVQDVKAAVRFLRQQHARFGIDAARVAVWGASAGAHIASMVAYTCGEPSLAPVDPQLAAYSDCVQGFVGWYGPYDLARLLQSVLAGADPPDASAHAGAPPATADAELLGGLAFLTCTPTGCPADLVARASTIGHVDARDPPALLLHGTADTLVPIAQSVAMAERVRAAGAQVELRELADVGHGWIGSTPERTRDASRAALTLTAEFLDRLFAP